MWAANSYLVGNSSAGIPEIDSSKAVQVVIANGREELIGVGQTRVANFGLRQGATEQRPVTFSHGVKADGSPNTVANTLQVIPLSAPLNAGQILQFKNEDGAITGAATLLAPAALKASSISATFTGNIVSGNIARGPLIDFTGFSWRGEIRTAPAGKSGKLIGPIQFDLSASASGFIVLNFPSDVMTAMAQNIDFNSWEFIDKEFIAAKTIAALSKIEKKLARFDVPFQPYYYDIETYEPGAPETVKRRLEGRILCIAETTTAAA